ncbi:MAG: Fic family protein [Deltaproteobacteria bacterium]|nr:Fic family protein [Deltaproteobacteria bacterium]
MDGRLDELDVQLHALREREARIPQALVLEFNRRLDFSCIYHDSALEGVVLAYSEIKAAIDKNIISDVSLIPSYLEIKQFKAAMDMTAEHAANKKKPINVETIRKLYSVLAPDEVPKGIPYRKENPLHRLYYHEISSPDKIPPRMKKLQEWMDEESTKRLHPVERAARAHYRLMGVFPWTNHTGRVARLLSNLMLLRDGYPPAIVHSIDRQRYYEVLRAETAGIVPLYAEAVATAVETACKFYDEATASVARSRAS